MQGEDSASEVGERSEELRIEELKLEVLKREEQRRRTASSFLSFVKYTKPDYDDTWFHRILADYIERWAFGDIKRLIVCMPPRHGKSELVSRRLPPYLFARKPNARIIACSYSQSLANAMSGDVQSIMDSPSYRDLFPDSRLWEKGMSGRRKKRTIREWHLCSGEGYYLCSGVRGGITGRGFTHGVIDDPFKDASEALSAHKRSAVWNWYWSAFWTRKAPDARILITTTRWHLDDLVGRLSSRTDVKDSEPWTVLVFQAEKEKELPDYATEDVDPREPGQYLWPDCFSREELAAIKALAFVWLACYQQRPTSKEGGVFRKAWFQRYGALPPDGFERYLLSVDCAFKKLDEGSDVCFQVWAQRRKPYQAQLYLLDEVCRPMGFVETERTLLALLERWPELRRAKKLVEEKANGAAILDRLRRSVPGLVAVNPKESKYARALSISPVYASRCVFVPESDYLVRGVSPASEWVEDHIDQLSDFPYAAKNDRVDTASQAVNELVGLAFELLFGRADILEDDEKEEVGLPEVFVPAEKRIGNGKGKRNGSSFSISTPRSGPFRLHNDGKGRSYK